MNEAVRDPIAIAPDESQVFERLMADHLDSTFRLAVSILGDADEARDATQEAFIAAWRELPKLRDPARASAWLNRITVNAAISRLRKRARDRTASEAVGRVTPNHARDDDRVVNRESLRAALWQLKPEHRLVLFLRFYEDLTVEQIARRIDVREGTVKSRLHYGIERLREAFEGGQEQGR
jgi:RNA polymerase sigma-70 factor (ECF subfamily)